MHKEIRKEPRLHIAGLKVKGTLNPVPDSEGAPVLVKDISPSGALVKFIGHLGKDMRKVLVDLVKASKKGNAIPVQLVLNNVKIPVDPITLVGQDKLAVRISDNERLATLAEKGRAVFSEYFQEGLRSGAAEAGLSKHRILGREFLPEGIRNFVEGAAFGQSLASALSGELATALPMLKDRVKNEREYSNLAILCEKFLGGVGVDVPLKVGTEMASLQEWGDGPDKLLTKAVRKICSEGRLFSGEKEREAFEKILLGRYFKNRPAANFSDLPKDSPLINIINTRLSNFDHENNFLLTLPPYATDFYLNSYLPRDSEIVEMFGVDNKAFKEAVFRWIRSALNSISIDKDRTAATGIEDEFKQAMYEYIQAKKLSTMTPADVKRLVEGTQMPVGYGFREKFFGHVCGVVNAKVREKFEGYKAELKKESYVLEDPNVTEARKIALIGPLELMLHYLWVKVAKWGLTSTIHKEVAKTFVPKEKSAGILEFGGMVVFDQKGFEKIKGAFPADFDGEKTADFFDVIDFQRLFQTADDSGAPKKEAAVGRYIQSLKPPALREAIIEKVVNSPEMCRFYVLKRPRSYFEKTLADKGGDWPSLIEQNMLTTNPELLDSKRPAGRAVG